MLSLKQKAMNFYKAENFVGKKKKKVWKKSTFAKASNIFT